METAQRKCRNTYMLIASMRDNGTGPVQTLYPGLSFCGPSLLCGFSIFHSNCLQWCLNHCSLLLSSHSSEKKVRRWLFRSQCFNNFLNEYHYIFHLDRLISHVTCCSKMNPAYNKYFLGVNASASKLLKKMYCTWKQPLITFVI